MNRRGFAVLVAGAAVAWPSVAQSQSPSPVAVVGFLYAGSAESSTHLVAAFREGLNEAGFVEGHNLAIEFRWANNDFETLPALAADLVRSRVKVIVTPGGTPQRLAAKAATSTIPIVFGVGSDPVQVGQRSLSLLST